MRPDCRIFNNPWVSFDKILCSSEPTHKQAFWYLIEEISNKGVYGTAWDVESRELFFLDFSKEDEHISTSPLIDVGTLAIVWTWRDSSGDHYKVQAVCNGWDAQDPSGVMDVYEFLFGED